MKKGAIMKVMMTVLIVISSILILVVCGLAAEKQKENDTASAEAVELIRLEGGDWGLPTPYAHYPRGPGGFKMCLIFDSLLERSEDGLIPWLAERYEISEDGKSYRFQLRQGVTWQDGTPFTPEDVKFTFEYATEHPMVWSYVTSDDIERIEVTGDFEVTIVATAPAAPLLYNLGRTRILPKHIWEQVEAPKEFTEQEALVGTGPYRVTDYSKEHGTYRFEANPDFWGPAQRVKVIEFVPVSEAILAFMQGEIDLVSLTPDLLARFQKDSQYKVVQAPAFWGYRLLFNMQEHPVFQQRELRQAIHYALDKNELVEKIARGAAVPGSPGVLPVDHILYNPAAAYKGPDLEKARQLLDQLGFKAADDGEVRRTDGGEELGFTFLVGGGAEVRIGELLKEQLARVGIRLTVKSVDRKTRDTMVRENDYELALLGHGGWGGDADYLRERFGDQPKGGLSPSASRLHGYENAELLALLNEQYTTIDEAQRKALIYSIQEMLADEVLEIPLYNTTSYSVYRPGKYDGWMFMFDHHSLTHSKLSYLSREK